MHKRRPKCADYRYGIRITMSTKTFLDDTSTSKQRQPRPTPAPTLRVALKTDIVVIGAGQAGLSSAYHLKKRGLAPNQGFVARSRLRQDRVNEDEAAPTRRTPSHDATAAKFRGVRSQDEGRKSSVIREDLEQGWGFLESNGVSEKVCYRPSTPAHLYAPRQPPNPHPARGRLAGAPIGDRAGSRRPRTVTDLRAGVSLRGAPALSFSGL